MDISHHDISTIKLSCLRVTAEDRSFFRQHLEEGNLSFGAKSLGTNLAEGLAGSSWNLIVFPWFSDGFLHCLTFLW